MGDKKEMCLTLLCIIYVQWELNALHGLNNE